MEKKQSTTNRKRETKKSEGKEGKKNESKEKTKDSQIQIPLFDINKDELFKQQQARIKVLNKQYEQKDIAYKNLENDTKEIIHDLKLELIKKSEQNDTVIKNLKKTNESEKKSQLEKKTKELENYLHQQYSDSFEKLNQLQKSFEEEKQKLENERQQLIDEIISLKEELANEREKFSLTFAQKLEDDYIDGRKTKKEIDHQHKLSRINTTLHSTYESKRSRLDEKEKKTLTNEQMNEEMEKLIQESLELQDINEKLAEEADNLSKETEELRFENDSINKKFNKLTIDHGKLTKEAEELFHENENLKKKLQKKNIDQEINNDIHSMLKQTLSRKQEKVNLQERVTVLEKVLSGVMSDFEHERQEWNRYHQQQIEEIKLESEGLRRLVKLKSQELNQIRSLSQIIVNQRTDVEHFLIESINQVKKEASQRQKEKQKQMIPNAMQTQAPTLPAKNDGSTIIYEPPLKDLPNLHPQQIFYNDLTLEEKERILFLLFSKINSGDSFSMKPEFEEPTYYHDNTDSFSQVPPLTGQTGPEDNISSFFITQ